MGDFSEIEYLDQLGTTAEREQINARARIATGALPVLLGIVAFLGSWLVGRLLPDSSDLTIGLVTGGVAVLFVGGPLTRFTRSSDVHQRRISVASEANEQRMVAEARRRRFETQLANAFEMADGESEALDVVKHALFHTLPNRPVEFLLADNSHAHLRHMVMSSPTDEPPGCSVDSPENCPAARRAQVQHFPDSTRLDTCPKLRHRPQGACSAVCVPVSIMGRTVGVIHATGERDSIVDDETVQDLQTLANQAGTRIGLLRIMAETQLQAATDSLTGLLNRRALENKVHVLRAERTPFSVAMADLDHFKHLNDTYGHETGDRALRLFAQTLTSSLRAHDHVGRHGGEEFAIALTDCSATNAARVLEQTRAQLAEALKSAGLPELTVSIGIVDARDNEELASIIERADGALFDAKRRGRDRIVVHAEGLEGMSSPNGTSDASTGAVPSTNGNGGGNGNGNGHAATANGRAARASAFTLDD
jgi:diguanylate cyclase (GGDEF)-like protein